VREEDDEEQYLLNCVKPR
jgi:hypothetical protein